MQAYRVETTIQAAGTLTLNNLPLQAGEAVEVIILVRSASSPSTQYPLRGTHVTYHHPTEPVASSEWDATA